MKTYKNILRLWIGFASIVAFGLGWIGLAHSPKPIQPQSSNTTSTTTTQLQPLPPMPSLSDVQQSGFSVSIPSNSNVQSFAQPVFRSGGS